MELQEKELNKKTIRLGTSEKTEGINNKSSGGSRSLLRLQRFSLNTILL